MKTFMMILAFVFTFASVAHADGYISTTAGYYKDAQMMGQNLGLAADFDAFSIFKLEGFAGGGYFPLADGSQEKWYGLLSADMAYKMKEWKFVVGGTLPTASEYRTEKGNLFLRAEYKLW